MPARATSVCAGNPSPAVLQIVAGGTDEPAVARRKDSTLAGVLEAAGEIAARPQALTRLIGVTDDPGATVDRLESAILGDPALATRTLALANSAYFALPRRVLHVREAVVFLGMKTVRSLALAVHARQLFQDTPKQLAQARKSLWRHSLDVALISRHVAENLYRSGRAEVGAEEAFTAGLLHDIGKLVLEAWDMDRALLAWRLAQERGLRSGLLDAMVFPYGHAEVGGELAARWMLPPAFGEAIALHHKPAAAVIAPHLAAVVALANEITHSLQAAQKHESGAEAEASAEACGLLGIDRAELPAIAVECRADGDRAEALHKLL